MRGYEVYKAKPEGSQNLKIALISPKGKVSNDPDFLNFWNNTKEILPYKEAFTGFSSGLLIIGSLSPKDCKIELIDENIEYINFNKEYDIVAISSMTQQATRAYQIADAFRNKGVKVIIGGIHATVLPEEAKKHADSVVIGEAEDLWGSVLRDFLKNDLKLFYRSNKVVDLNKSPIPRYDLLNKKKYKTVWIQVSRGCPMDCEFCCASNVYGYKYRYKSVPNILKELRCITERWGRNILVSFADDNIFVNKKFSEELIKKIAGLKIRWFAQTDITIGENSKLLGLLRKNGCAILFIGFESLDYKNLKSINKNGRKVNYLNQYSKIVERIQSYGIGVMASFVIGFDEDTPDVVKKLSDFIIENNIFASQISILTPLPGTRLRDRLKKEERLLSTDWDNYTFTNVNFTPSKMSVQDLQNGLLDIYKQIYSREATLKKARHFKKIYLNL